MPALIGHHRGFLRDIGLDDRDYIGRVSAVDVERANLRNSSKTIGCGIPN
jgi:hypothetical protein